MNSDFQWNLQQVADGIPRGVLEERAKRSFLYPHDNIWPKDGSQFIAIADTIYDNLNADKKKLFLTVCLASFLINLKKTSDFPTWFQSKSSVSAILGLDLSWDEVTTSWRWGRVAIPGADHAEGWNDRILYALVGMSKKSGTVLQLPPWIDSCLSNDSRDSIQIAAELVVNRDPGMGLLFWPQLDSANPNIVINGASLGLPVYLSFCSLATNNPIPSILATGSVNSDGILHEVTGLEEKFRLAHKKGFNSFLYPLLPGVKPLDFTDKVNPIGVQDLEQACSFWISQKTVESDGAANVWMTNALDKIGGKLSEVEMTLSERQILADKFGGLVAAWYDYIIFTRIIRRNEYKNEIVGEVRKLLPVTYNPLDIYIEARVKPDINFDVSSNYSFKPSDDEQGNLHSRFEVGGISVAAFEAAGLYGFDVIGKFAIIDDHIYDAMSNLAGMQIDNLADLSAKLQSYDHFVWGGLAEKGIDKIAGHLGEVYSAENLGNYGLEVQWPEASNQAGWDLLVNGHEMNVKTVADFSELSRHFTEYPEIPVIIPGDTAHIPLDSHVIHLDPTHSIDQIHDALASGKDHLVFVDHALSHAEVLHHTTSATEAALGHTDAVSAHFPFITCAFSGFRELGLLLNDRTDVMTSLKHVTLDVGGTGGGGFAGAKAGAMIGSLGGPIGTIAGTIVGGVLGAICGRSISNVVKYSPLETAKSIYVSALESLRIRANSEEKKAECEYRDALSREQLDLERNAALLRKEVRVQTSSLRDWRRSYDIMDSAQSIEMYESACLEIEIRINKIYNTLKLSPWWRRWFWPNADTIACQDAIRQLKYFRRKLTELFEIKSAKNCYLLLGQMGLVHELVRKSIESYEADRRQREKGLVTTIIEGEKRLADMRIGAFSRMSELVTSIKNDLKKNVEALFEAASSAMKNYERVARKY